jgi:hypothetical protein
MTAASKLTMPNGERAAICPDCGVLHAYTPGTRAGRKCTDCFRPSRRLTTLDGQPAAKCPDCGVLHAYTPNTPMGRTCAECFRRRSSARQRAWQQAKRTADPCVGCGKPLPLRTGSGKPPLRCRPCRTAVNRARDLKRYYSGRRTFITSGICEDCGITFERPGGGGPVPACCLECTKERNRERDRRIRHIRRARKYQSDTEVIRPSEIYERDEWTCGICGLAIDRLLRWPHPGSPSIDHRRPIAKGGSHTMNNVQSAHLRCNLRKAAKYQEEAN